MQETGVQEDQVILETSVLKQCILFILTAQSVRRFVQPGAKQPTSTYYVQEALAGIYCVE